MDKFISIPLKTTFDVDFSKSLKKSLDNSYSGLPKQVINQTVNGIAELNLLRKKACASALQKDLASLELLMRYNDQVGVMENKLPIPAQCPVAFKWNDAFDKGNRFRFPASLTVTDWSFEKAAVSFNCGALMSAIAANQSMSDDEQLKTAARLFQQSAGVFAQLKDQVTVMLQGQKPTTDMVPDCIGAFSALMLAQAQETIYIKAAKDGMKPTSLSKVAQQLAEFYQITEEQMNKEPVNNVCDKSWLNAVTGKKQLYSALAQFHQTQALADAKDDFGEQLSRLGEAQKLLNKAKSAASNSAFYKETVEKVTKALEKAKRENDYIYHAHPPEFSTLPELPKTALVKPTPVQFPMSTSFTDLFETLVQEPNQKKTLIEKVWKFLNMDS
ncbi:BRO1-like domain-containing protein [Ditylenchus destructor]|nr:BRO1-like domain-containing protein [Ditylenchus destructor]